MFALLPVIYLKLKGRAAMLKLLSTSGLGNTGKRYTITEMSER